MRSSRGGEKRREKKGSEGEKAVKQHKQCQEANSSRWPGLRWLIVAKGSKERKEEKDRVSREKLEGTRSREREEARRQRQAQETITFAR